MKFLPFWFNVVNFYGPLGDMSPHGLASADLALPVERSGARLRIAHITRVVVIVRPIFYLDGPIPRPTFFGLLEFLHEDPVLRRQGRHSVFERGNRLELLFVRLHLGKRFGELASNVLQGHRVRIDHHRRRVVVVGRLRRRRCARGGEPRVISNRRDHDSVIRILFGIRTRFRLVEPSFEIAEGRFQFFPVQNLRGDFDAQIRRGRRQGSRGRTWSEKHGCLHIWTMHG